MPEWIKELSRLSKSSKMKELEDLSMKMLKDPFTGNLTEEISKAKADLDPNEKYLRTVFTFYQFAQQAEVDANAYSEYLSKMTDMFAEAVSMKKRDLDKSSSKEEFKNRLDKLNEDLDKSIAACNEYLNDDNIRRFIVEIYGIQNTEILNNIHTIQLYKVGTTSYIFKVKTATGPKIIKCLKLRYFDNPTIINDTENYNNNYGEFALEYNYVPRLLECKPSHIIMICIEGKTLREYINAFKIDYFFSDDTPDMSKVITIWCQLCDILKALAQTGIHHLDLSPDNIMVDIEYIPGVDGYVPMPKVYLIDFGYNYLLGERIGTVSNLLKAQLYISRELFESNNLTNEGKLLADVYSLGIILIEILSNNELSTQKVHYELDKIGRNYTPGLSQILEEMIDANPKTRMFQVDRNAEIYEVIKKRIKTELEYFQESKKGIPGQNILIAYFESPLKELFQFVHILINYKKYSKDRQKMLAIWKVITYVIFIAIAITFWEKTTASIKEDTWKINMPGYLVAISFAIPSLLYYKNIFGYVDAQKLSWFNELLLRCNSFVFCFPIFYALIKDPLSWAYCSAIGVFIVALSNWFNYKLVVESKNAFIKAFSERSDPERFDDFIKEAKEWGLWMAIYSILLLLVGICTYSPWISDESVFKLKDVWAYAIIVVIINSIMAISNCVTRAPAIRYGFIKSFMGYEKARLYKG